MMGLDVLLIVLMMGIEVFRRSAICARCCTTA